MPSSPSLWTCDAIGAETMNAGSQRFAPRESMVGARLSCWLCNRSKSRQLMAFGAGYGCVVACMRVIRGREMRYTPSLRRWKSWHLCFSVEEGHFEWVSWARFRGLLRAFGACPRVCGCAPVLYVRMFVQLFRANVVVEMGDVLPGLEEKTCISYMWEVKMLMFCSWLVLGTIIWFVGLDWWIATMENWNNDGVAVQERGYV